MANTVRSPVDTILGEAVHGTRQERYADMLGIASVISNRSVIGRVSPQEVVAAPGQFSAYGKSLPPGASAYRELAQQAWDHVQTIGPVTNATYYSTPETIGNLPSGLEPVDQTKGHVYQVDPQNRPFATTKGFVKPSVEAVQAVAGKVAEVTAAITAGAVDVAADVVGAAARGMEALAPNGLRGAPQSIGRVNSLPSSEVAAIRSNLADVSFNMGPNRPNRPDQTTVDIARSAVRDVLGPGYTVDVISGMENPGTQYGSNRHKTGLAADIQIKDPYGNTLNAVQDRQAMTDVAQAMAAKGALGIGIGTDYMGARGIHVDQVTPGVGQAHAWGNIGRENIGMLTDAMRTKEMPASFYSRTMPAAMDVPPSRPAQQPSRPVSPTPSTFAAPVEAVERGTLSPAGMAQVAPAGTAASPLASAPRQAVERSPLSPVSTTASIAPPGTAAAPLNAAPVDQVTTGALSPVRPSRPVTATPAAALAAINAPAPIAAPANLPPAPANVPVAPPAAVPALPAPVAPPVAAPRATPQSFQAPPSPPSFSPADVYSGRASQAMSPSGNLVSRDPFGHTAVTNKYGVTTAMVGNRQAFTPGPLSINGPIGAPTIDAPEQTSPFGGLFSAPQKGKTASMAKTAMGSVVGSVLGGLLGPVGAVVGGMVGRNMAQGLSPLGKGFANSALGSFPDAPKAARGFDGKSKGGISGFGSGKDASKAEADRGGRGASAGGKGLW